MRAPRDPELDAAGRRRPGAAWLPRCGAVAADAANQRDVDRDDDDRRGDEADPKQGVDLVGARGVRRQSAAILITSNGGAAASPASASPTYTRRPYEEAPPAITRAATGRSGPERRRPVGAAIAVPLLRRRLRMPAPVTVAACAAGPLAVAVLAPRSQQARRRPLRDADVGLHDGPRDSLRRPRAPAAPAAQPLPDRQRPRASASAGCRTPACSAAGPPARRPASSTASSPGPTGSGSSSPTSRWP